MIRVTIFEDNDSLRETLAQIIDDTDDLITIGQYPNALAVVEAVRQDQPDVVLMDIEMPGRTGIEAVRLLGHLSPRSRILMLTVFEEKVGSLLALGLSASLFGFYHLSNANSSVWTSVAIIPPGLLLGRSTSTAAICGCPFFCISAGTLPRRPFLGCPNRASL